MPKILSDLNTLKTYVADLENPPSFSGNPSDWDSGLE
jgi:hypothetical protein